MAYSNGRIYVDTSVTPNVGVSIADLQQCFAVVIEATIAGQTVRKLSGDLGVHCALKTGDTFTVDGVTWRVASRRDVNLWARYRPIPCADSANNTPNTITPSQRMAERYGIDPPVDMFTADVIQSYEDYANALAQHGSYFLKSRPWGSSHWKRLTDFVKTDEYGNTTNLGYDNLAQPDNVKVTISSGQSWQQGIHYLAPLIPEGQRTLVIPTGSTSARFHLPNDHLWMDVYYAKVYGSTSLNVTIEQNEEWLSPIDLMGTSTYRNKSYASVRRRILIFHWADSQHRIEGDQYYNENDAQWRFFNYATDLVGGNRPDRPFSVEVESGVSVDYRLAWLDLTDSEAARNTYYAANYQNGMFSLKNLKGRCLFIDCWLENASSMNLMPICGYAYEVNIIRSNIDVNVDVSGVLTFVRVVQEDYTESGANYHLCQLFIDYAPSQLGLPAGLTDAGAQAVAALRNYYDSLTVTVGSTTVNLLDTSLDYETDTDGAGDWFSLHCVVLERQTASHLGSVATVTAVRKNTGVTSTKYIGIEN